MSKIAIILHAEPGTHDAMGRAAHALLYTKELKEADIDVKLFFDGGGTRWVKELSDSKHPLKPLFDETVSSGSVSGVCQYCVGAFGGDVQEIADMGLPVSSEYMGHPSIAALIRDGYQIITL